MASGGICLFLIISCAFLSLAIAEIEEHSLLDLGSPVQENKNTTANSYFLDAHLLSLEAPGDRLCFNTTTGEAGVCMFTWSCDHVAHGVHIGNCLDRFIVYSCCKVNDTRRIGKPNTNSTPSSKPFTSESNANSNKTAETAKENFPEVESLDEIINATSIGPFDRKPASSDIRITNTSHNDDFLIGQQSNQQKVPEIEQIMKEYVTFMQSNYGRLNNFQFNSTQNEDDKKPYDNTETQMKKIPSENSDPGRIFYYQDNMNNSPYEINNHEQQSHKQKFGTNKEQSELQGTSYIGNAIKNAYKKNNTNAKPVTTLMPHKLNDNCSTPSSTISPSHTIKNESESLYKVNISATSYSLLNEDTTLPESWVSTPSLSLNSSEYSDLYFSVSSSEPTVFEPVSSPSETTLLQDEVTTAPVVNVLKDSSAPSLDIFPSNSINATESPYEVNISSTLSSINGTTHSGSDIKKLELERITSWVADYVKNRYKNNTNAKPVNPPMPQKVNDDNSTPSSTIAPSNFIKNESDALYKVNISQTLYTSLEDIASYDSSESTSNLPFDSTSVLDTHFLVSSLKPTMSESVSSTSDTELLPDEVITPSAVYVSNDSSAPSLDIFPSINNATESLHEVNISDTLYYLTNKTTSYESSESTSNLGLNFTKNFDPHISVSSSKPSNSEAVSNSSETESPLAVGPNSPSVYVFTNSSASSFNFTKFPGSASLVSSWKLEIFEPISNLSETAPLSEKRISPFLKHILNITSAQFTSISPYISVNNETDLLNEGENETKYESSVNTSNLPLNFPKLFIPHLSPSSKATMFEPGSILIGVAPLPNIIIRRFFLYVLKHSRAPSPSSSLSNYNSIGSDSPDNASTISDSASLHDGAIKRGP